MPISLKRVYDEANDTDEHRILVDRVWPRGVAKRNAHIDEWAKEVGPSKELRQWFGHDPEKFHTFRDSYIDELRQNEDQNAALQQLQTTVETHRKVTLVFAAKDETYNHAQVLKEVLGRQ